MNEQVQQILAALRESGLFPEEAALDVNALSFDDDNALHIVIRRDNISAAIALIEAGIDINKAGDLGYTPLHVACMQGNSKMIEMLIDCGADLFALSEGVPPFTSARLSQHHHICELLAPADEASSVPRTVCSGQSTNCAATERD